MLVLTRKLGESIHIGDDIVITLLDVRPSRIRLGIDAAAVGSCSKGRELADGDLWRPFDAAESVLNVAGRGGCLESGAEPDEETAVAVEFAPVNSVLADFRPCCDRVSVELPKSGMDIPPSR